MSRGGRGKAETLRAEWPAIPWTPLPITEREKDVAAIATVLMASGEYATYLEAANEAERRSA